METQIKEQEEKSQYAAPQVTAYGSVVQITRTGGSTFTTDVPEGTVGSSIDDITGVYS